MRIKAKAEAAEEHGHYFSIFPSNEALTYLTPSIFKVRGELVDIVLQKFRIP